MQDHGSTATAVWTGGTVAFTSTATGAVLAQYHAYIVGCGAVDYSAPCFGEATATIYSDMNHDGVFELVLYVDRYLGATAGDGIYVNTTGKGYADFVAETLTVQSVDASQTVGTVTLNADDTITYERPTDWSVREDSYQYTITDATGQTDTVTNTIALHTAKPDVDVDSNNNGVIDGADDVIEEDPPGAAVLLVEPEPIEGLDPPYFSELDLPILVEDFEDVRLAVRFDELASPLPGFDLVITTTGPIRLWMSTEKQEEVVSGQAYTLAENSPSTYFPAILYAEASGIGAATIRLELVDPRGISVDSDLVALLANQNQLPRYSNVERRQEPFWVRETYELPSAQVLAETDLDKRVALVKRLIEERFNAQSFEREGLDLYKGVLWSYQITKDHVDGSKDGLSGWIMGFNTHPAQVGADGLSYDFSQVQLHFMPWKLVFQDEPVQWVRFNENQIVDGPGSTAEHEGWHTDGIDPVLIQRAQAVGVTMHSPGMVPQNPGPNDYEIKRGFRKEVFPRLVSKVRGKLKDAKFDPSADPRKVAVDILEDWLLSTDAQGKISEAGYWHQSVDVEVGLGIVFTYTKPGP